MRHIASLQQAHLSRPSVVTVGVFDGVHRGHQHLLRRLVAHAAKTGAIPVVLTFHPLPRLILNGYEPGQHLTLPGDRARLLGELGVELVITHPFDDTVRHIRAADFVDRLVEHLSMRALWVGEDFAMGYKREGNVAFLRDQARQKGFDLRVVDLMDAGNERVSSTRVRTAVATGDVLEATRLLGRPHFVFGEVVEGEKRGRAIGIPTANLAVPLDLAVPARGVYTAWAVVGGQTYPSAVNIGIRPTFDGTSALTVEAHLLNFSGDLYGQRLYLHFLARLREERKFDSVDALVAQIREDIGRARELFRDGIPGMSSG